MEYPTHQPGQPDIGMATEESTDVSGQQRVHLSTPIGSAVQLGQYECGYDHIAVDSAGG